MLHSRRTSAIPLQPGRKRNGRTPLRITRRLSSTRRRRRKSRELLSVGVVLACSYRTRQLCLSHPRSRDSNGGGRERGRMGKGAPSLLLNPRPLRLTPVSVCGGQRSAERVRGGAVMEEMRRAGGTMRGSVRAARVQREYGAPPESTSIRSDCILRGESGVFVEVRRGTRGRRGAS
jgi:hypothetical protein